MNSNQAVIVQVPRAGWCAFKTWNKNAVGSIQAINKSFGFQDIFNTYLDRCFPRIFLYSCLGQVDFAHAKIRLRA